MTRLYENIVKGMAPESIKKKRHVLDNEPDVGKLKLKEGSIIEYIPSYNNLFNKGKMKVFPLQTLEEIIVDPSKYNHTKKVVQEQIQRRKERESRSWTSHAAKSHRAPRTRQLMEQGQVLGSKYRFQKRNVQVATLGDQESSDSDEDAMMSVA